MKYCLKDGEEVRRGKVYRTEPGVEGRIFFQEVLGEREMTFAHNFTYYLATLS